MRGGVSTIVTASTTSRLCISEVFREDVPDECKQCRILTRSRTVKITNNVGHTGLVAHNSRQVDGLFRVILPDAASTPIPSPQTSTQKRTLGKALTFPRWRAARLRGRKPSEP